MCLFVWSSIQAQSYFFDDFETYTVGNYVGTQSSQWKTWSGNGGGSDDVDVDNTDAFSGSKSLYFYSANGNGPHDVVLDFGGVHNSGTFKYRAMYKIPTGGNSYFNFQGGAAIGSQWSYDMYFYSGGTWSANSSSGTFPHDQWFELVIDVNFDTDTWKIYIDGSLQATINNTNPISYLDLYEVASSSEWYIDDVSFCVNKGCNPELELSSASITPGTVCTHHAADFSVNVKNNSNFSASSFVLGVNVGTTQLSQGINLNNLAPGRDTTIVLTDFFKSPVAGSNIPVDAINLSGDLNANNDTAKTTVNVNPSPENTAIIQGTPYQSGTPNTSGTSLSPDVVTAGEVLTYEVVPPSGFSNGNYGTAWNITGLSFYTSGGATVANSYYSFNTPSGGNATIAFTPDAALLDSTIMYTFAVNDMNNGCDSILQRYILVVPRPVAGFTQVDVCDQQEMSFTNTSTIQSGSMSYLWDFGDGNTSVLTNPTHTYATYGAYTVKLYTTSGYGYVDSSDIQVTVFQLPTADFTVNNACEGSDVNLADNSFIPTGTPSFTWEYGDGTANGSGSSTGHMYAVAGNYSVTMTVTVNGCSDSKTKYATQAPRSMPDFTSNVSCNNTRAAFTNQSSLAFGSYGSTWKFGDGMDGTARHIVHNYAGFGNFDVTLVNTTDQGCMDSITKSITLIESPSPDFSMNSHCSQESVDITNLTNVPTGGTNAYMWDFGNGSTSMLDNPTTIFPGPGTYTIRLVVHNTNGCSDSIMRKVTIDTKPIAAYVAEDVCEGSVSTFTNNTVNVGAGTTYSWDFGDGSSSVKEDESFTYAAAGAYNVSLVVSTANGCTDTVTKTYNVNAIPSSGFSVVSGQKGDGTMVFDADESGQNYHWFMGDGNKYQTEQVVHTYQIQGSYQVRLTVTSNEGCTDETSQVVSVTPNGISDINASAVKVYPNPSQGAFTVELTDDAHIQNVMLVNALGQSIDITLTLDANGKARIETAGHATGMYVVRISTDKGVYTEPIHLQ